MNVMQIMEFLNNMCVSELNFVQTYIAAYHQYPLKNRSRRHNGLLYTINGTETYHFHDSKIDSPPGSVLYIPKGENYETTLSGEESVVIVLDFEIIGNAPRPFLIKHSDQNTIKSYFTKIETEWNKKYSSCLPECKSLFYRIVGLMSKQLNMFLPSQKSDKISDAVEYLHQNYLKNDFRLESAAEVAGISYRYFETLFRQKYGSTPKEYVISLKIERAKELLLSEKILIKDIAVMLGYSDIYHFGRLFTARTGHTPSEYRNSF